MPELLPTCSVDDSSAVLAGLRRHGVVVIDKVNEAQPLVRLGNAIGSVVPHRDSGPDGVTVIEDRGAQSPGMAGFTRNALPPHTDRSGVPVPPGLILTACTSEPTSGGEAVLVDGRAIYDDLAMNSPHALEALSAPRSVMFGGADGFLGAIFSRDSDGLITVRFRQDALIRFAPSLGQHLALLRSAISRHAVTMPVRSGVGYVVNNRQWLHGRRSYQGSRVVVRVNVQPENGLLPAGFRPTEGKTAKLAADRPQRHLTKEREGAS